MVRESIRELVYTFLSVPGKTIWIYMISLSLVHAIEREPKVILNIFKFCGWTYIEDFDILVLSYIGEIV